MYPHMPAKFGHDAVELRASARNTLNSEDGSPLVV